MASHGSRKPYTPSTPPAPEPEHSWVAHPYKLPAGSSSSHPAINPPNSTSSFGSGSFPKPQEYGSYPNQLQQNYSSVPPQYGYGSYPPPPQQQQNYSWFPPGTHLDVIRSFRMADINQNGCIEETELQEALARSYQKFSLKTLRLLIFLFKNHRDSSFKIGPKEFTEVWSCLGQWRAIFERFDRDRSGKIDSTELRDALYSLGYALPPPVLQVLISRYNDGTGRRAELNFDSFVECGMIVKGLTEKFKEKDPRYTGSATLNYDTFMSMIIPFLVADQLS